MVRVVGLRASLHQGNAAKPEYGDAHKYGQAEEGKHCALATLVGDACSVNADCDTWSCDFAAQP